MSKVVTNEAVTSEGVTSEAVTSKVVTDDAVTNVFMYAYKSPDSFDNCWGIFFWMILNHRKPFLVETSNKRQFFFFSFKGTDDA